ncbi:outer dynein arm-docking complex subunit 1-like [Macrosteles quadrilineatus]|uniref:outer dynein arm-docking complex subunit 1-like n=1 Tax=Macrosteles quadrilineatus TaxID=74068 RepID=UPI0023E1AC0B|nr:outer dynein arm-docking complex subunit 1-like [Macrosteles quadrilineatus]
MAVKVSMDARRKISEQLEREEEQKRAQKKAIEEQELKKLTTQARMMKESKLRDAVAEKQAKVKNILVKEKVSLEDNLRVMNTAQRCLKDTRQAREIANLFAKRDHLDAAIAQEKKNLEELEYQIRKDSQNIQAVKKNHGFAVAKSEYLQKTEAEQADRSLQAWSSRLAAEKAQLAMVIKSNEEMRSKLQRLIKEKGQFNKLFGELMEKLTKGKGIMVDIVERSRQNFKKRDDVHRKIEALRSRDKVDLSKRMEEMQELEIRLDHDTRLNNFRMRVQQMREKLSKEQGRSSCNSEEQKKLAHMLETANDFLVKLQEFTGLTTSEEISNHIVAEESKLFSMFNLSNEIRDQLEVLTYKTAELVSTVNEERETAEQYLIDSKSHNKEMHDKLGRMEHELNDMQDFYDANRRVFNRLLDKTQGLCDLLHCNTSVLRDLLGENSEVTQHNFPMFLNLLETEVISALDTLTHHLPWVFATSGVMSTVSKSEKSLYFSGVEEKSTVLVKKVVTRHCFECNGRKTKML